MAKSYRFDKPASLEANEVVREPIQEVDAFTEPEQAPENEQETAYVVETPIQSDEFTKEELAVAKELSGEPHPFDHASAKLMERFCLSGIAADFGTDGYARGYRFFNYFK